MTTYEMSMYLFTFADGTTAAGIGTSVTEARTWLRTVAIPPYDTMDVAGCEDYRGMTAERKAEIAELHALRNFAADCPECGVTHECEPWATTVCAECRRRRRREDRTPVERWQVEQDERHGPYAVLAGFEEALAAHDDGLRDAYDAWDVDVQIKLFQFVVDQVEAAVQATRMALKGGVDVNHDGE